MTMMQQSRSRLPALLIWYRICVYRFVDRSGGNGWSRVCSSTIERCTQYCRVDLFGAGHTTRCCVQGKVTSLLIYCVQRNFDLDNLAFCRASRSLQLLVYTCVDDTSLCYERKPVTHCCFQSILPSLISGLARESVKAVAGSEMYRLEIISPCQAQKPIRPRPGCMLQFV